MASRALLAITAKYMKLVFDYGTVRAGVFVGAPIVLLSAVAYALNLLSFE